MSEEQPKNPSATPSLPFQGSMMSAAERAERADQQLERALAALETLAGAGKVAAESYASVTAREIALRDAELEAAKRTAAQRAQAWELLGALRDNAVPILNAVMAMFESSRDDASTSEILREIAIRMPLELGRKRLETDSEELAALEKLEEPTDTDRARMAELQETTGIVRGFIREMDQRLENFLSAQRSSDAPVDPSHPMHFTPVAPGSSGRLPSDLAAKICKEAEQRVEMYNRWLATDRASLEHVLKQEQSLCNHGELSESMQTLKSLLERQKAGLMASIELNERFMLFSQNRLKKASAGEDAGERTAVCSIAALPKEALVEERASRARALLCSKLAIECMLKDDGDIIHELRRKEQPLSAEEQQELDNALVNEAANHEALLHLDRMIEQSESERAANGDPPIGIRLEYDSEKGAGSADPGAN